MSKDIDKEGDKDFEEALKQVDNNPKYKVNNVTTWQDSNRRRRQIKINVALSFSRHSLFSNLFLTHRFARVTSLRG